MIFKLPLCLLCLAMVTVNPLAANAQTDDHAGHDHDHGKEQEQVQPQNQPQLPPLTQDEAIDKVKAARIVLKDQLLAALTAFKNAVQVAEMASSTKDDSQRFTQLTNELADNIKAITEDRYVSTFAGRKAEFTRPPMIEAHETYTKALDTAEEGYANTLMETLRRDDNGHLGTWVKSHLDTCIDIELMSQLTEWYWHHGQADIPPGSFDSIIKISYRLVQLEPQSPQVYCNAAWLLWSRWVSWTQDKEKMPVGENDDQTAIAFLLKGRKACMDDASYHYEAAMTVWGLARHHKPEYWDFILDSLKLAEKSVKPDNTWLHTRIRLTLGHVYRQLKDTDNALKAYRSVLEIDPKNEVANRIIDELEHPEKQDEKQI